ILRDDCWAALRDAHVDAPSDADLGRVVVASEPEVPSEVITEAAISAVEETVPAVQAVETTVTVVEKAAVVVETPAEEVPAVPEPEVSVPTHPAETDLVVEPIPIPNTTSEQPTTVTPQSAPQRVELPASVAIPATKQPTTVTFKPNKDDPEKFDVIIHPRKTHREYFVEFCKYLFSLVQTILKDRKIRR
ncbi:MAG: hypothetical protein M3380_17750, partial [Chloroflexota bacterium]|nr:hypothetical protein [Chloroflexota bacterium]